MEWIFVFMFGVFFVVPVAGGAYNLIKRRQQLQLDEMKHKHRLQLLEKAEDIAKILLVDKELGWTVVNEMARIAPPPQLPSAGDPGEPAAKTHLVRLGKKNGKTACEAKKVRFMTSDVTEVTCKRCLRALEKR